MAFMTDKVLAEFIARWYQQQTKPNWLPKYGFEWQQSV